MPQWLIGNSTSYFDLLGNILKSVTRSERRGLLTFGVLLQHDSARPRVRRRTKLTNIKCVRFQCILHPPNSKYLTLSDLNLFRLLKLVLGFMMSRTGDGLKTVVHSWLHSHQQNVSSAASTGWRSAGAQFLNAGVTVLRNGKYKKIYKIYFPVTFWPCLVPSGDSIKQYLCIKGVVFFGGFF